MKSTVNGIDPNWKIRVHPYVAIHEGQSGGLNLRKEPERIETDLEDFRPWLKQPAVQRFFELLRWINGETSPLESSDCAFRGPHPQTFEPAHQLCADGRLMILFRDLDQNASISRIRWLCEALAEALEESDPDLPEQDACVDIWAVRVLQLELSHCTWNDGRFTADDDDPGHGHHLLIQYFALGDDEGAVFKMLDRVIGHLATALQSVASQIR